MPFRTAFFGDIAGQLTRASVNADKVTSGCVLLPQGGINTVRKMIRFPKWKFASDSDVDRATTLLRRECLAISGTSIDKTSVTWTSFWDQASTTPDQLTKISHDKRRPSLPKPATLVKFLLYFCAFSDCHAQAMLNGGIPEDLQPKHGPLHIRGSCVIDKEIDGKLDLERLDHIRDSVNVDLRMNGTVARCLTIDSIELLTDGAECLLTLADYVAGITHAFHSQADTLSKSNVSPHKAAEAYERLAQSGKFIDKSGTIPLDYFAIFPAFHQMIETGIG